MSGTSVSRWLGPYAVRRRILPFPARCYHQALSNLARQSGFQGSRSTLCHPNLRFHPIRLFPTCQACLTGLPAMLRILRSHRPTVKSCPAATVSPWAAAAFRSSVRSSYHRHALPVKRACPAGLLYCRAYSTLPAAACQLPPVGCCCLLLPDGLYESTYRSASIAGYLLLQPTARIYHRPNRHANRLSVQLVYRGKKPYESTA